MKKLFLVFFLLWSLKGSLFAQGEKDYEQELKKEEKKLEEIRAKLEEYRKKEKELKGEEKKIEAVLKRIEGELSLTQKLVSSLKRKESRTVGEIEGLNREILMATAHLKRRQGIMEERLRYLYKHGRPNVLEFLFSTQSFPEMMSRYHYLRKIVAQDRKLCVEIQSEKLSLDQDKKRLKEKLVTLSQVRKEKEREEENIIQEKKKRENLRKQVKKEKATAQKKVQELEEARKKLETLIAELERRRKESLKEKGIPPPAELHYFEKQKGRLSWPLEGQLVSGFGKKVHPLYGTITLNNGIDIKAEYGAPVRSIGEGKVVYADRFLGYGKAVLIDHQGGFYTLYSYLSEILVSVGEEVGRRREVGRVGDSGTSEGPLLHFELRKMGKPVDPLEWLKRK